MKKYFVLVLILTIPLMAQSFESAGGIPGQLFLMGNSARSLGMGRAYTGLSNDEEALLYNPAGLSQVHIHSFTGMPGIGNQLSFYGGASHIAFSLTFPAAVYGTFGMSLLYSGMVLDTLYDNEGNIMGGDSGTSVTHGGIVVGYAKRLSVLGLGVAFKGIYNNIYAQSATGVGIDVGAMIVVPSLKLPVFQNFNPTLGFSVINLLQPRIKYREEAEIYPKIYRGGLSLRFLNENLILSGDVEYIPKYALLETDTLGADQKDVMRYYIGMEYVPVLPLSLRIGFNMNEISFGLGLIVNVKDYFFNLNYAILLPYASEFMFSPQHRLSFTYTFKGIGSAAVIPNKRRARPGDYIKLNIQGASQFQGSIKEWRLIITDAARNPLYIFYGEMEDIPSEISWQAGHSNVEEGRIYKGNCYYILIMWDKVGDELKYTGFLLKVLSD